jgi:hypothetical protein
MARSVGTALLMLLALGSLGAGVWMGLSGDGDTDFGVTVALLCAAPMLALLALAARIRIDDD